MQQPRTSDEAGVRAQARPLYTPEERRRRDATRWTLVQGLLAPVQFLVFGISVFLVLRYLLTGAGENWANGSILLKTLLLYTIMVTGAIWEKVVFGRYLFAPAFYWEDVFSMLVLALHTLYVVALFTGWGTPAERMEIALAGYAAYVINATQFLLKLRAARLQAAADSAVASPAAQIDSSESPTHGQSATHGRTSPALRRAPHAPMRNVAA